MTKKEFYQNSKTTGKEDEIKKLLQQGKSQVKISKELNVSRGTLIRFMKRHKIEQNKTCRT